MNCHHVKDLILQFDFLEEDKQAEVFEHIEACEECQAYFDKAQNLDTALDIILRDYQNEEPALLEKKKRFNRWQTVLIACAATLLLAFAAWSTPPVKAAIEKALNYIIADKFKDMETGEKIPKEKIIVAKGKEVDGRKYTIYVIGDKQRINYENGDYSIFTSNITFQYNKERNDYIIFEGSDLTDSDILSTYNPDQIKPLGPKQYVGREVEAYLITDPAGYTFELWFDKKTSLLLKEIQYVDGKKASETELSEFKIKEIPKDHKLFDLTPPEGAKKRENLDIPSKEYKDEELGS
ncbi:hypothetical protein [Metabacillus arenae]|uniref:Uncharacterized protein n=1 Tax=Metabacillus arenae TaxID=2771434 RepID=A0A926NIQ3_9BACI|nr:hypothetical protein [Metabacillus arenae]MBD1380738.1 hypothetical protein [Metabacillus arenae]